MSTTTQTIDWSKPENLTFRCEEERKRIRIVHAYVLPESLRHDMTCMYPVAIFYAFCDAKPNKIYSQMKTLDGFSRDDGAITDTDIIQLPCKKVVPFDVWDVFREHQKGALFRVKNRVADSIFTIDGFHFHKDEIHVNKWISVNELEDYTFDGKIFFPCMKEVE